MNHKQKIFTINATISLISSILFRIIAIFFNGYITDQIGKEMLGVFNLVMSVYIFGITLSNFGINFTVTKLISEALAVDDNNSIKKLSKYCIFLSFTFGIITSFIFIYLDNFIISKCLHSKVNKDVIYLICIAFPFISMSASISGYFTAVRKAYKSSIAQFFEQIIKIFVTIFCLKTFLERNIECACFALILGDLVSEIFSFLFNFVLYKLDSKRFFCNYTIKHSKKYFFKKILKISLPIALTSFMRSGLSTIRQIIIPISFEKASTSCFNALSIYGEINGMVLPIIFFPNVIFSSVSNLLIPEFSAYLATNNKNKIRHFTKLIITLSLIFSAAISLILFVFSKNLGMLIYKDLKVSHYIKILSPMAIFVLLDCVIDNILKGINAQNDVMIINILDLFVNIILIYLLIPKFSISGYLAAIYFSEIFNLFLSFRKLFQIVWSKKKRM